MEDIAKWCKDAGIKYLTVYAFSTENWNRSQAELDYLFNEVFDKGFSEKFPKFKKENIKVNIFGELERFPEKMQQGIRNLAEQTKDCTGLIFNVCLNYGGRAEIVRAIRQIVEEDIPASEIDEKTVSSHLYSAGMPDPDLMIRAGGEHRLSNFLLWQQAYTELYFPKTFLPGFTKQDFDEALEWYANRERRYGK